MGQSLTVKTFITNSTVAALGLANSIILSRWLGPTGRGEVAAALLWPILLVYLSSIGLIPATLYFAAQEDAQTPSIFATTTVLGLLQSLVAIPLGFIALPWLLASQSAHVVQVSRLFLLVIPITLLREYGTSILQGRMHISMFNWLRIIIPFGYLMSTLALFVVGQLTVLNILIALLVLQTATLFATLIALAILETRLKLAIDFLLAKQMLKYGVQIQLGDTFQGVNLRLDQMIMAAFLTSTQLGHYVVAVSAASLLQILSTAVRMVMTPSITQSTSPEDRVALLQVTFRRYWFASIIATVGIGVVLPVLIPLVFGADFGPSIWPAEVLLLGALFLGAKDVLIGGAQAMGKPLLGTQAELAGLVVTIALLALLLPLLGIMGAAIASLVAYSISLAAIIYGLRRAYAISLRDLFRIQASDTNAFISNVTQITDRVKQVRLN